MTRALTLLTLLAACGPTDEAPEGAPPAPPAVADLEAEELLLAWEVTSPRWGRELLLVKRDGRTRFLQEPGGLRAERTLTSGELAQLRADLRDANVCASRSGRDGTREESRPQLTLAMDDDALRCDLRLWWGEWSETAAWPTLDALRRRLRTEATPLRMRPGSGNGNGSGNGDAPG